MVSYTSLRRFKIHLIWGAWKFIILQLPRLSPGYRQINWRSTVNDVVDLYCNSLTNDGFGPKAMFYAYTHFKSRTSVQSERRPTEWKFLRSCYGPSVNSAKNTKTRLTGVGRLHGTSRTMGRGVDESLDLHVTCFIRKTTKNQKKYTLISRQWLNNKF